MSIETRTITVFTGTPTNDEQRACLQKAGFVHVTGLPIFCGGASQGVIGENLRKEEWGKWGQNNGMVVVVTEGGEVWLSATGGRGSFDQDSELLKVFCPNGQGAFVPCSTGEQLPTRDLLLRAACPAHRFNLA